MLQSRSIEKVMEEPVRKMVTKRLIGVISGTPLRTGVSRMLEFDIEFLAVTEAGKVVGFITDSNVMRAVADGVSMDVPIDEVMTRDPIFVDVNTPVREVLNLMSRNRVKYLMVTGGDEVEGIITLKDLEDITRQRIETHISRE